MKLNVEIEIDWIDEESNIDDEVRDQLINALSKKLENDFLGETGKLIANAAEKLITAKTEQLIYSVLEKPCTISNGWHSNTEYESIYEMVEKKMTDLYQGKLNTNGQCTKDPLLANIEKYVENHINTKIRGIESTIDKYAKVHAANILKKNKLIESLQAVIPEVKQAIDK